MATDRRDFIKTTAYAGIGAAVTSRTPFHVRTPPVSPNGKVVVGVIGVNGRGVVHAQNFAKLANSEVGYICDVDSTVIAKAVTAAEQGQKTSPKIVTDFRKILDDK